MDRVYLTFAKQDLEAAERIALALEELGVQVILNDLDGLVGDEAGRAARASSIFVLCSRAALMSPVVQTAARRGLAHGSLMLVGLEPLDPGDLPLELRGQRIFSIEEALAIIREMNSFASPGLPQPANDALYRARIEIDDEPPTLGSAPVPQAEWDEVYRKRIAESDDPPTLASAPMPAAPAPDSFIVNDILPLDRLSGWMTARESALHGEPALASQYAHRPFDGARAAQHSPSAPAADAPLLRHAPSASSYPGSPPAESGSGSRILGFALLAALGITVAFVLSSFGRDVLDKLVATMGVKLNAFPFLGFMSKRRPTASPKVDTVDCSVFSPPLAPPGSTVLVQVFLHIPEQAGRATFMASVMDQATTLKGVQTLQVDVARGSSVTVTLSATGLDIDEPQQTIVWRGAPVFCQFLVGLPEGCTGKNFHPVVRVSIDGGLVGRIVFALRADAAEPQSVSSDTALQSVPQGTTARRYNHAFLSYASPDRKEVLKRAQVLQAAGVSFFQDTLKLDPGTRWEKAIYKNIDTCDLFLLFWSKAALDSEWVIKEAEYALRRQGDGDTPDIVPVILEVPPLPPASLAAIHFNDRIHHLISAS